MNKLSICTACMNRAVHLRQTLPANILENMRHPNLEFVILDYNSPDGLEDWAKENLRYYINSGKVKYYKTYEPAYFHMSQSKNMAIKLATGNIICLMDADNFAGPNYANWVDSIFKAADKKIVITNIRKDQIPLRDQAGKMCFLKEDFNAINGFDESLIGYGMEDVDLVNRMDKAGLTRVYINDQKYLKYIEHSNYERVRNFHLINNLANLYLRQRCNGDDENRALYLLNDNSFDEISYLYSDTLKGNQLLAFGGWVIKEHGHRKGNFQRQKNNLVLTYEDGSTSSYGEEEAAIISRHNPEEQPWKRLSKNDEVYLALVMGYGECFNRLKFIENNDTERLVNNNGWGHGTVYLNFDRSTPIRI